MIYKDEQVDPLEVDCSLNLSNIKGVLTDHRPAHKHLLLQREQYSYVAHRLLFSVNDLQRWLVSSFLSAGGD